MNGRVLGFAVMAFLLPLGVLLLLRSEDVSQMVKIDPHTTPGKLLYFTSPS